MGRTPNMDIEKEIEKAKEKNNIDHLFTDMILMVDEMTKYVTGFNKGYDSHGRILRFKLARLTQHTIEFRKIIMQMRYHRITKKKLEKMNSLAILIPSLHEL